jgi:hypothetical protein
MKKIKVLLNSENVMHQCAVYRLWPIQDLDGEEVRGVDVEVKMVDNILSHDSLMACRQADVIIMQRPHRDFQLEQLMLMKSWGKKVWIDYDDDLLNLPQHHSASETFNDYRTQQFLQSFAAISDVITVSSEAIKKTYDDLKVKDPSRIHVVRNGMDSKLYQPIMSPQHNFASDVMLWRGSPSHVQDVNILKEILPKLAKFKWCFMGAATMAIRKMCEDFSIRAKLFEFAPFGTYMRNLRAIAPRAVFVPLVDDRFNEGKSNVAWLEATWAGAATFATQLPEFVRPGIKAIEDYECLLSDNDLTSKTMWDQSAKYILSRATTDAQNELRMKILSQLMGD